MAYPIPVEHRQKIIGDLNDGYSYGHIALKYKVSKQSIADLLYLQSTTGSILPREGTRGPQTNKLTPLKEWIKKKREENPDWSLQKFTDEIYNHHNLTVNRVSLWRFLKRHDIE